MLRGLPCAIKLSLEKAMGEQMPQLKKIIYPETPWRVTRRDWHLPLYGYRISTPQWRALLARAKTGDSAAEWRVADCYGDGCKNHAGKIVVRRSRARSARWLRRAAVHGSSAAQTTLGVLLGNGDGVPRNVDEALFWLRKAFHAGEACAAHNIAITYREIGDFRAAVRWLRRSVQAGDGDALIELGIHYYWGKGVRRNPKAAVRCFRMATRAKFISEFGRDDAFFFLGVAHLEGKGAVMSIPMAIKSLKRANVDNDHPVAGRMLDQLERESSIAPLTR